MSVMSKQAQELLAHVVGNGLFLTPYPYWRAIPPVEARGNPVWRWQVNGKAADELLQNGSLELRADFAGVIELYQHTEEAARALG